MEYGRFLDLMDQKSVEVDGYYKLPLLLKEEDFQLPNNRAAVIKWLKSLKRNFDKDYLLSKHARSLWKS